MCGGQLVADYGKGDPGYGYLLPASGATIICTTAVDSLSGRQAP
jgi:hypothetical protein